MIRYAIVHAAPDTVANYLTGMCDPYEDTDQRIGGNDNPYQEN